VLGIVLGSRVDVDVEQGELQLHAIFPRDLGYLREPSRSSFAIRHGVDTRRDAMKFVLLIYQGTTPLPGTERWQTLSEAEQKQIYADYARLEQIPGVMPGLPLGRPEAARTVRVVDGEVQVKAGPYQAEGAGGYSVYECENLEAAIALAARIPAARLGGAIEVRPAEKYW
jgi:hypothetical protein